MVRNRSWPAVSHWKKYQFVQLRTILGRPYYLQLDTLAVEFNGPDLKVNANSRDERGRPGVVTETQEQA
jgi:hypothetical protein